MRIAGRMRAAGMAILAAILCSSLPSEAARKKVDYLDKPIPQWREGPVRYLMTRWEDDEYKALSTDEDRARFIENFWRRRDETPGTPGNEFRAEFWKRVRDANRLYADEVAKDGWRTDMGKIHVLRGPPDDITRDSMAGGHRGTVIWTYRQSGVPGVAPNVVIAFAKDVTGEFRLSAEPTKDADPKQGSPLAYQPAMGTTRQTQLARLRAQELAAKLYNLSDPLIRQAGGPATSTPLGIYSELAKLTAPPKEWEIRETISTQEFFGSVPMRARADFFMGNTGHTLVVLTASVSSAAVMYRRSGDRESPDVVFYGRVTDLTGNDLVASLEKDSDFAPADENQTAGLDEDLVFQGRLLLAPGVYKATLTVLDRAGGRVGSNTITIRVPDLGEAALTLSSLMLARKIEPLGSPDAPPSPRPYLLGGLRVLPRLGQTFHPGDELAFYYQVYGATPDPASGKLNLDVEYAFHTVEGDQTNDVGRAAFAGQQTVAHGYALSLKEWPPGPYLLRVTVTDRVSGATTLREAVFEIR